MNKHQTRAIYNKLQTYMGPSRKKKLQITIPFTPQKGQPEIQRVLAANPAWEAKTKC